MPDAPAAAAVPDDPAAGPATLYAQAGHATPEALQRAYRLVVGSEIGFWERNLRTGEMWYSPDFYRTLGLTEGFEREQIKARLHPQDRHVFEAAYAAAIRDIGPFTYEARYRALDGEYRWARASGRVWPGADGRAERLIGTIADVHAEKCAMLELETLARRFERAMDASSEAHFEQTVGRDDFYLHPRLSEMLGHPPGTPAPTLEQFWRWLHPDDLPQVQAMFELRSGTPGSWEIDYRLRQHDGSYRYIRSRGRSERGADGLMRLTGVLDDVQEQTLARQELEQHRHGLEALIDERTARLESALAEARRQREQAEQANEAKSSFLAHMSHEIRTPLNGVLGMAELALRESSNDQQRRHLKLALQSGRALMSILNDVLDFSRIAAGGLPSRDEPFDLAEVLAESLRSIMPAVRDRGLGVMYDVFGSITRVRGDWQRLQQIATNLLANAAKFTERGHIELIITTQATGPGRCQATIVFRDTGPGMTPQVAARVFEPFVQGDDSLARRHGGTGLGLSIALGLARSMGGDLTLQTSPGAGSAFTLTLPLQVQPGEQPAARRPRPGLAWLVYTRSVPAQWLAHRLDRMGWRSEIVAGVPGLVRRATTTAPDGARPDLVVLAEAALDASVPLLELRGLLPTAHMVLLVRPDWNQPQLEAAARAGNMPLQFMPITPQALIEMLDTRGPSPARPESGFMDLPFLPDLGLDVLVAEDNPVNQIIVSEMIDSLGLRTRLSGDGAQAIEACCLRPPALVLMDLQMPGMDGLEATRALRRLQRQGQLPPFPIVALTAHATPQDRDDCMEAGMVGFLTKPVAMGALRSELARWLQI